jgi:alkylhydroperoxidase family enzyme
MAGATARIVVQATPQDKKVIAAKAKMLGLPVSELMRRGAVAYESGDSDAELAALADAAKAAADRAGAAIDAALDFITASEKRISAMETKAAKSSVRKAA